MKFINKQFFLICAGLLLCPHLPARAAETPPSILALAAGDAFDFSAANDSVVVRVPVSAGKDLQPGDVLSPPVTLDISREKRNDLVPLTAITPSVETENGRPRSLLFKLDLTKITLQGKYDVLIEVRRVRAPEKKNPVQVASYTPGAGSAAVNEVRQLLTVHLTHPQAMLDAGGPLKISYMKHFPFGICDSLEPWYCRHFLGLFRDEEEEKQKYALPKLVLREVGQQSRLTNIVLELPGPGAALQLGALPPGTRLDAGKEFELPYALSKALFAGKQSGELKVHAPQLAAPVIIPYEIHVRHSYYSLFAVLLAGLLAGFFIRQWLKRVIDLNKARMQARELRRGIQEALRRTGDATFKRALEELRTKLQSADDERKTDLILQAVSDTRRAFDDACARFNTRREAVLARCATLGRLLNFQDQGLSLPITVRQVLQPHAGSLKSLQETLAADLITQAEADETALSKQLAQELRGPVEQWRTEVEQHLINLSLEPEWMSERQATQLEPHFTALYQAVRQTPEDDVASSASVIIENVHNVRKGVADLLRLLQLLGRSQLQSTLERLEPNHPGRARLLELFLQVSKRWMDFREDVEALLKRMRGDLQLLQQAEKAALDPALPPVNAAAPLPASSALPLPGGTEQPAPRAFPPAPARSAEPSPSALLASPSMRSLRSRYQRWKRMLLGDLRDPLEQGISAASLLQSFAATTIVIVPFVTGLVGEFSGTRGDFLRVFFWAFSADLSLDAAVTAAKAFSVKKA